MPLIFQAGDWPLDMAESLARLALGAAEMKRRQRPDLEVRDCLRSLLTPLPAAAAQRILVRVRYPKPY